MGTTLLPAEFRDLEFFSEWALEQRKDRFHKRVSSSMEKITAFYNAMVPRLDAAVKYLNNKSIDSLDAAEQRLLSMCLSLIEVSRCIERWNAPDNDAYPAHKIIMEL